MKKKKKKRISHDKAMQIIIETDDETLYIHTQAQCTSLQAGMEKNLNSTKMLLVFWIFFAENTQLKLQTLNGSFNCVVFVPRH